jgi:hypothetical protein
MQARIASAIHFAHAAGADQRNDLVSAKPAAGRHLRSPTINHRIVAVAFPGTHAFVVRIGHNLARQCVAASNSPFGPSRT